MKKVLLLSVCLIVSFMFGGKVWASVNYTEDGTTLTIHLDGTATDADVSLVSSKMNNSNYTKVVVVGGIVTDKFAQSIFYTQYNVNTVVTSLDFSGTSYTSDTFEKSFFNHSDTWRKGNLKIASLSLPGNITKIGDESVQLTELAEVVLPDAVTYIGKKAFANTKITEMVFPANLDKVDDAAFYNVKIKQLKLNNKLRFIGNTAFGWDNNDNITLGVLDIPESVKYIGPAAFANREYRDVYFHSEVAPIMPCGVSVEPIDGHKKAVESTAFSSYTLMGNNGFTDSKVEGTTMDNPNAGYANRENYYNNHYYFAILHYPKTLTAEKDIDTYTDYTRKYLTNEGTYDYNKTLHVGEETTAYTGFENQTAAKDLHPGYKDTYVEGDYIWPSQSQWMRAYLTAVYGVKWNGVDTYRTQLTQEELDILAEAGYKKGDTADEANGVYTLDQLQKMAHQGTRMFVLANNDSQNGNEYHISMKGGKWWTLCVPFNMTKKQVSDVFGDKTNVCLFNHVKRTISQSQGNRISLYFTVDVCQRHTCKAENKNADGTWNTTAIEDTTEPSDDDIVIFAHESYMIRPSKTDDDAVFVVENYEPEVGNPVPTVVTSVVDEYVQDADQDNTPEYRFIGNYLASSKVPQYSYVYATKDAATVADRKYKFWFITDGNLSWSPNKSVVQTNAHGGGAEDYNSFFDGNANSAKVKQASIFGIDDDTTGLENMVIIAGEGNDAPVYSVDGKMVSSHGDTTGLAKGVYIQNGKKFIVK